MQARCILVLLLLLPSGAQAFYQWQDDNSAVELRGLVRDLALAANNPNDDLLYRQDKLLSGGVFGRLMLDAQLSSVSFEMHVVQSYIDKELRTGGSRFTPSLDVERSDALHWRFADQHADFLIDRFNLNYANDNVNIKLGRQPVNLATTYYFTPNDFFSPFAAQTFYRTYKSGVDAARLDWQWGELSQLTVLAVLNYSMDNSSLTGWHDRPDWSETSYLVRASTLFGTFEWAVLAGEVNGDDIVGVDFQGELFNWLGVRGEGHLRFPDEQDQQRDSKLALAFEHRFENTLTLRLEEFYQRMGVTNEYDYNFSSLNDFSDFYLARHYTALGANYELTPLLIGDAVVLFNHLDSSSLLALYSTYSLSDESELSMTLTIPVG
ncbi:MAG: hypothetical protein OEY48_06560, partial [Gammaproteobacteria bacterium]|nr:hypothetical protein [Gammaproteobacteria bacterium]